MGSNADPESWDCDCYEEAHSVCERVEVEHTDLECLRAHYCNFPNVCQAWKDQFCNANLDQLRDALLAEANSGSLTQIRQQQMTSRANATSHKKMQRSWDSTTSSKNCF